jgi:hypothetical protein
VRFAAPKNGALDRSRPLQTPRSAQGGKAKTKDLFLLPSSAYRFVVLRLGSLFSTKTWRQDALRTTIADSVDP